MQFDNITGLYALLGLVILLILYLRRPKPMDKVIPSLMFLIKQRGIQKKYKFFRRLLRNLVLILQILTIVAFAFFCESKKYFRDLSLTTHVPTIWLSSKSVQPRKLKHINIVIIKA